MAVSTSVSRRCNCFWRLRSLHFNTASLSGGYPTCIHRFNQRLLVSVWLLPRDSIQYYNLLWRRCLLPSRYFSVLFLVRLSTTFGTSSAAQCFFVLIVVLSALLSSSQYYFWYVSALLGYFQDVTGTSHYYFWYFQHCYVLLSTIFCTSQYDSGTIELRSVLLSTSQYYFLNTSALLGTS